MSTETSRGPAGEGALLRVDEPLCVCVCVCVCVHTLSRVQLFATLDYNLPGSPVHGISQARITGVGCHFPLQGIFPILGLNPHLWHRQANS